MRVAASVEVDFFQIAPQLVAVGPEVVGAHKRVDVVEVDFELPAAKLVSDKRIGVGEKLGDLRQLPSAQPLEADGVQDGLHRKGRRCALGKTRHEALTGVLSGLERPLDMLLINRPQPVHAGTIANPGPGCYLPAAMGIGQRLQNTAAKAAGSPWFWVGWVLFLFTGAIVSTLLRETPDKLPILGKADSFRAVDHHGNAYGSAELYGRVWVASLTCIDCPFGNPEFTDRLFDVQHRTRGLAHHFRLVTFSIDPENDTPAKLKAYAAEHRVSAGRWVFLTGDKDAVYKSITEVFGTLLPRGKPGQKRLKAFNSQKSWRLALVDQQMRVRGYYDVRLDEEIDALIHDLGLVANRGD
ncbi:MAG: protein SCO1/2 [Myxococcota bacterium]|jgi:protein SCO1/2